MRKDLFAVVTTAFLLVTACTPVAPPAANPSGDANPAPTATLVSGAGDDTSETAAEAEASDLDILASHPWQWISFSGPEETFAVDMPESYVVAFGEDGIVEIVADCNTAIASYGVDSLDAGGLSLAVAPRTTDTCPEESRSSQFLTLLAAAAEYSYVDGQLHIGLTSDDGTLVFAPATE